MSGHGAGGGDILAGRAYIELLLKDRGVSKSLTSFGQKLQHLGKDFAIIGGLIAGVGAAITGPMLHAMHSVVEMGTSLQLMHERTGQSVESLSELRFAAEQTGATL